MAGPNFSCGAKADSAPIEAQLALRELGIGPMAAVAVLGENGLDRFVERQFALRLRRAAYQQHQRSENRQARASASPTLLYGVDRFLRDHRAVLSGQELCNDARRLDTGKPLIEPLITECQSFVIDASRCSIVALKSRTCTGSLTML